MIKKPPLSGGVSRPVSGEWGFEQSAVEGSFLLDTAPAYPPPIVRRTVIPSRSALRLHAAMPITIRTRCALRDSRDGL
jgi:hypothetical protein